MHFGRSVNISNSAALSQEIFDKLGVRISATTVQRLFELVSNKSFPSQHTLNVFSEYTGCASWDDFRARYKEDVPISNTKKLVPDEFGMALFQLCLKNQHYDTVLEYFSMLPDEHIPYKVVHRVSNALGLSLRRDAKARHALLEPLAKRKNGRVIFYENFVDIDYIHDYYVPAIKQHYSRYISPIDQQKYNSDWVFASALEFISYIKRGDKRRALACAYALFQKFPIETDFREFSHAFPYARLLSTFIISEHLKNQLTTAKVAFCLRKLEETVPNIASMDRLWVLQQVTMALNYCGRSEDIIALYHQHRDTIHTQQLSTNINVLLQCVERAAHKLGLNLHIPAPSSEHHFVCYDQSLKEPVVLI